MPGKSKTLRVLDWVSVVLLLAATALVFFYAPEEQVMGLVQKVFYFHVAAAWVGMLGFGVALAAGIAYLITSDLKWDLVELAAVEVGIVFLLITIVVGSIW